MINYKVFESKEDWSTFRSGLFTASEIHRLLATPKKKDEVLSQGAKTYILERVAESLAPKEPDFYNRAMEHGNETEPQAVLAIAEKLGKSVNDDDFIYTSVGGFVFFWDDEYNVGGTPDVILKDSGLICEVKCPASKTHLEYLMLHTPEDVLDCVPNYYYQMQLNMYLTHTDKCLFVSYDDRYYNKAHHYHSIGVPRDEAAIELILTKSQLATEYKNQILEKINGKPTK